jgi:hypothetical protein
MIENIPASTRAGLVRGLVDAGCDRAIAEEAIDLACHAVDSAIEAVATVCARASCLQTVTTAHHTAFALLPMVAKVHQEGCYEAAQRVCDAFGIKITTVEL